MPVQSRLELRRLLATIARRKCVKAARRALAAKRGGGLIAPLAGASDSEAAREPTDPAAASPEQLAVMADLYRQLLDGI